MSRSNRPVADASREEVARLTFPWKDMSPEEYVARESHKWGCSDFETYTYSDSALDSWIQRWSLIMTGRGEVTVEDCRRAHLTAEELRKIEEEIEDQTLHGL